MAAGAVDMVLPLDEIGRFVAGLLGDPAVVVTSADEAVALDRVFVGPSETAAFLQTVDWAATPLGPVSAWPASLAAAVRTMLDNPLPVIVHWGPDLVVLPNDAAVWLLGADVRRVVGRPLQDAFPDEWATNGAAHLDVLETGQPRVVEDASFTVDRGRGAKEIFLTSALTALRSDQGGLAGTMSTALDTTDRVLGQRQLDVLRRLQVASAGAATVADACARAVGVLEADPGLVPFALVYLIDGPRTRAQLAATGSAAGRPRPPPGPWPSTPKSPPGPSTPSPAWARR